VTSLTLVRHGQTDWNLQRRIQGQTDIPLNDTGRRQARQAGDLLAERHWDAIAASPLSRAYETASIISARLGLLDPHPLPGLVERHHGAMEGMTSEERREAFAAGAEVPGLETDAMIIDRVLPDLSAFAARHEGESVLVVTHGGVIGSLVKHLSGGELPVAGQLIANGSFHDFSLVDGTLEIVAFNGTAVDEDLVPQDA